MSAPIGLRIGARVRCTSETDPFIDYGTEGTVTNTMPQRPPTPARARILWDSDQSCLMDAGDFEVIPQPVVVQPTVMAAFPAKEAS